VVNGTGDASIEAGDELGTTRMSVFRVVFRVTVEAFDAAARGVSLRAMKGRGRESTWGLFGNKHAISGNPKQQNKQT
jgi:hypothetical protein